MSKIVGLAELFSAYYPDENTKQLVDSIFVTAAEIDPEIKAVKLNITANSYICQPDIQRIITEIRHCYGIEKMTADAVFSSSLLASVPREELRRFFIDESSVSIAVLAGAQWDFHDNTFHVKLRANGADLLETLVPAVRRRMKEMFDTDVNFLFESNHAYEGSNLTKALEDMRQRQISEIPVPAVKGSKAKEEVQQPKNLLYGKPFKGNVIPMGELSLDMGYVVVEGRVFSVENKELPKRNAWVIKFDMTDNTGAIRISRFMDAKEAKPFLENVHEGDVLKIQGKLVEDRFENDIVLKPYSMMSGSMKKRMDTCEYGKRVELHLHTKMSNMDALTDTAEAVKLACQWGHKAIAITDHGCAQSFPDALHAQEKLAKSGKDIKILYGCEGYYVNDVDDRIVVHGEKDISFDDEYVAFDLETTGLSAKDDTIIEFGAVIMKNGEELSRFQEFVNPGRKLSPKIIDLTGIDDAMLAGADNLDTVLPKFLDFIGDRVLVAHNADFDTGFLRVACQQRGLAFQNTFADTLILSQNLLPELSKYKLDIVADSLSLPEFEHHRAADDAITCGLIYEKLCEKLKEMGISRLQAVNTAMESLRSASQIGNRRAMHIILLAKNQVGLRNLYHLISDSNLKYFKRVPRIPKSELIKYREGIIIGSACEAGEVFQAIVQKKSEEEIKRLASFYDYLEIQPLANNMFMLRDGTVGSVEDLKDFNRKIVGLGEELGKPVAATCDAHFLNPTDEIFRHILLATKGFDDCDRDNPLYFRTTDEMLEEFSYLGVAKAKEVVIDAPNYITDMCESLRPVPHNLFAPKIENSVEDLKNLVYTKLHRLYGENPPELITKRVETELGDIINCHYDVIYMSAQKLVQNSLEHGYLVGSRGSVGSSIVAYMSGITEVNSFPPHYRCPNPECKYTTFDVPEGYGCGADLPDAVCPKCGSAFQKDGFNIPFETFLGFGGDKVPDIDLNFSGEYQAKAHAYCVQMFGKSHVFRAGTIGGVADKTAYGYVKKYLAERGKVVSKAEENRLTAGCVGVRRTTGQHPGGLVVIPQENEIWDFCPVQHPADDTNSDTITTHFEYHSMEENLLKLDMLGHDDPTMIRMMEDMSGVDAKTIPLDDKDTMSIFTSSKVLGYEDDPILGPTGAVAVPEFNTRFTRQVLVDTQPKKFDFLVRISGYTHGTDVWLGNAKDLITSGVAGVDQTIGCRDDIMLYLISCGMPEKRSFKIMESVRKGRGLPEGAEEEMIAAGVPEWYIGSCKKVKYLFPKAHAVAYVMMAFRIAWFKVNYPLAFYSAYFYRRSQKGGFDVAMMTHGMDTVKQNIEAITNNEDATDKDDGLLTTLEVAYEFYLRGFEFLPIDIYTSDATKFKIVDGKLLPPFVSISGLGESAALDLVRGREGKTFISLEEVAEACPKVSKTHMTMLKEAGAFGSLPDINQVSLF